MRGLFSAKVPNSSIAEVSMGLLIEPTHMEDEDEEQENEKEDERDGEECRVEGRRVSDHPKQVSLFFEAAHYMSSEVIDNF